MTEKLSLKERANYEMVKRLIPVKEAVKKWFCRAGMKFLQSHQLTDEQWTFLEDVTDFYIDNLENIEKLLSRGFLLGNMNLNTQEKERFESIINDYIRGGEKIES